MSPEYEDNVEPQQSEEAQSQALEGDDVEGHRYLSARSADQDDEQEGADVEGHRYFRSQDQDDEQEGDDVEGHRFTARSPDRDDEQEGRGRRPAGI